MPEPAEPNGPSRASMPVRIYRLGEEPPEDLRDHTTAGERLEILRELTERAWTFTGRPFPSYSRDEVPIRVVKRE